MRRIFLFFVFFALLLAGCSLPMPGASPADDLMATIVAATMQALTPQATPPPAATSTPQATPATASTTVSTPTAPGSISGDIHGYPGAGGQLTVMAFNQATGFWYYVILQAGVFSFSISDLPAGRYQVVVYDLDDVRGGTPPTVDVAAGQDTSADVNDWGGGYPANPNW